MAPTSARFAAACARLQFFSMFPSSGTTGSSDATISTSLSLTIHAVPFGNTDVKVATIERRSRSLIV